MVKKAILAVLIVAAARAPGADAARWPALEPLDVTGRFEYFADLDRRAVPFPWNASSRSLADRTRLMLQLRTDGRYGGFYVKGAAVWDDRRDTDTRKRLRFSQADYLWQSRAGRVDYSVRLFANERRFFVSDMIAPLVHDDRAGTTGANRGARIDAEFGRDVDVSVLYSLLGEDDDSRGVTYARASYTSRIATVTTSYLFDDPGRAGAPNHAVFKTEVASAYRGGYAAVAYEQSGFDRSGVFFPQGRFHFGRFDGDNFSHVLPDGAAVFAETRLREVAVGGRGAVRLVYRYAALGRRFVSDLGVGGAARVGHTAAVFFKARGVELDARIAYHAGERFGVEQKTRHGWEGAVWGRVRNGTEFFARGRTDVVDDRFGFDSEYNLVHLALHREVRRFRAGAHIMWKDLGTPFSGRRFAWDGKLALTPDWGVHWRLAFGEEAGISQAVFTRIEYRPTESIYATIGYGRDFLGDSPYLLEDPDLELADPGSAVYTVSLRGDF